VASISTAVFSKLEYPCVPMKCLDELNYGQIEGLTEYEFKVRYQDAYQSHL
jgi:broad specificity phosphatase PhoE